MAATDFVDFAELKNRVKIEQVVPMLGLQMRQKGDQMRGPCPRCKAGGERALAVNTTNQSYYCFAEGKGGDLIALTAHIRDLSQRDAALLVQNHFENSAPVNSARSTVPVPATSPRPPVEARVLRPLDYLQYAEAVGGLGLSEATCTHFGAGYAPKGIMRGRFAVPIHDRQGTLLAYVGIAVAQEQSPKLLFPNGFDPHSVIFNADKAGAGELYLVRDPLQVLTAFESGVE